jgi:glutamate formiminotransferase
MTKAQWRTRIRERVGAMTEQQRAIASARLAARLRKLPAYKTGLARHAITQVSLNLLDYGRTSLLKVFERVKSEAARRGISVRQSELVGLAPRDAFAGASPESLALPDFTPAKLLETYLPPHLDPLPQRGRGTM